MKKIKLLMLGILSVLTLGLFVVTGTKATAASDDYTIALPSTISDADVALPTGWSGAIRSDSKTFGEDPNKGKKALTLREGKSHYLQSPNLYDDDDQLVAYSCTVDVSCAYSDTGSGTFDVVSLDSSGTVIQTKSDTASKVLSTYTFNFDGLSLIKNIKIIPTQSSGKNLLINTVTITYGSPDTAATLDHIAVSNATVYYTGDTFSTDGLTVTAFFDNDKSRVATTDEYSYSFSPALVDGKFSSATTYTLTATATIGEVEKSATTSIIVTDATKYSVIFKQYSTDVDDYATVSNIVEGESIGATNWPAEPRVLNKSFEGWFDGDDEYNSNTAITADTTLVAKYTDVANDLVKFEDYNSGLDTEAKVGSYDLFDGVSAISASGKTDVKKGTAAYTFNDGTSLSGYVQGNKIQFVLTAKSYVYIYVTETGEQDRLVAIKNGDETIAKFQPNKKVNGTKDVFGYEFDAGTYTLECIAGATSTSGVMNYYGIKVCQNTQTVNTATVFAEKNSAGTALRFVGALTGVSDLKKVSKIELLLAKDGVAANPIELTSCYTSVDGTSKTCDSDTNKYYVIFRLNGINKLAEGTKISKQLKITFTDNKVIYTAVSEITL